MTRMIRSLCFLASLVVIASLHSNTSFAQQSDWQSLFNGKDLTGWQILNAQYTVVAENGMLVGRTGDGQENGYVCTTEQYGDFILELDFKTDLLLDNTGIQIRSLSSPDYKSGRVHGFQVQVENRPPHQSQWNGAQYDEAGRGFLYIIEDDPKRQKAYKQNQWNRFRIEAIGTTTRVWINGIAISHVVDDEILKGMICFQLHGGALVAARGQQSFYVRDIRIQTANLKATPYDEIPVVNLIPNTLSGQEKSQGFELLFDGKSDKNWRGVASKTLPANAWKIGEDAITIPSPTGGTSQAVAMTEKQYGPFELKFDFKIHGKEGIAGIGYYSDGKSTTKRDALYGKFAIDSYKHRAKLERDMWKEWNLGVIRAFPDNRVEYWLNGYKIQEYYRDADQVAKGTIILDAVGVDTVSYRSIKIRELKK